MDFTTLFKSFITLNIVETESEIIKLLIKQEESAQRLAIPLQLLANATGKERSTVLKLFKRIKNGVGEKPGQLRPYDALMLMQVGDVILMENGKGIADNVLRDHLMPLYREYLINKFSNKSLRRKSSDKRSRN